MRLPGGWRLAAEGPVLAGLILTGIASAYGRDRSADVQALMRIERQWMNARDAATLGRILADDFVHIGVTGALQNKGQVLQHHRGALPPDTAAQHLEDVRVRIYGNTGVVNGRDIGTRADGSVAWEDRFTDVFVRRRGGWQAVNAQETLVRAGAGH